MKNNKTRIYLFDNIKFFLIVLVVACHYMDFFITKSMYFQSAFLFSYAFHMPLFIFIAGLFHKETKIKEKCLSFIFIGLILKIIYFLCSSVNLNNPISVWFFGGGDVSWYSFAIACFIFLSSFFQKYDKKKLLILSFLLALFCGFDRNINDNLFLSRIIVFFPFYLLGQMINKKTIIKITENKKLKIICALVLIGWLSLCIFKTNDLYFFRKLFTGKNSFFVIFDNCNYTYIYRLLAYIITIITSFCFICLNSNKKIPLVSNIGTKTLQIYFWHYPILILIEKLGIGQHLISTPAGKLGIILISVLVVFVCSLKIFEFPIKQIKDTFFISNEKQINIKKWKKLKIKKFKIVFKKIKRKFKKRYKKKKI